MDRTFDRREAFALARPYSALVLGRGSSFFYRDGSLCYLHEQTIRVLNVHGAERAEHVIYPEILARVKLPHLKQFSHIELLNFQKRWITFLYVGSTGSGEVARTERWLMVIDTQSRDPTFCFVRNFRRQRIWVRNDRRYLYIGAHDTVGAHGHHEWRVEGFDLCTGKSLAAPLLLPDFWGYEMRETIAVEIFDDYLYVVSNRSSYEVEEIDWTSFYHCQRFPLDQPLESRLQRRRIVRRQHREGPIHDSWTDLSLHRDEETGQMLVVEARMEWRQGITGPLRTFYTARLDQDDWARDDTASADDGSPTEPLTLPNEQLASLVRKGHHPLYAEPRRRIPRDFHREYAGPEPPSGGTFPISRTRYRTFLPASSAFLDVVLDDYPLHLMGSAATSGPWPPIGRRQIRLRIGSRVPKPPCDPATQRLRSPTYNDVGEPVPHSEEKFRDRGIRLWPPTGAPAELFELLHPAGTPVGELTAVEDERSLVYRAAPTSLSASAGDQDIVLVNFDRGIRHAGLPLLQWSGMEEGGSSVQVGPVTLPGKKDEREGSVRTRSLGIGSCSDEGGAGAMDTNAEAKNQRWCIKERAMHLDIGRGYRFE